jgi:hypothetical protein
LPFSFSPSWSINYQPNVVGLAFRSLFAVFAKGRIHLALRDYENMLSSFYALWKEQMVNAARLRPNFACNPSQAFFDPNEDWKLRYKALPEFDIFGNFDDLMSVFYWVLATDFMLRRTKEVRLTAQVIRSPYFN